MELRLSAVFLDLGIGLLVVERLQLMQINLQVLQQSRLSQARAICTITKKTTGATDGPKSSIAFALPVNCGQTGWLPQG
jgi:hypothetical protein